MARLQGDDKPTYILSYGRWVRLGRLGAVILLAGVALVRWALAWISFVRPVLEAFSTSANRLDVLAAQPLRPLIAAHLSLVLVAGAIAFLYDVLPDLSLADDGLAVRTVLGWKSIPWSTVKVVRIMSSETTRRRLVLVQGNWARWSPWPRLVSVCLGAGYEPGVLLTSDIRDFKPLMRCIYEEVKQARPDALFDDEFLSPSALMVLEPTVTLDSLVDEARSEGWPLAISAQAMTAVPAGLVLVQLLILLLRGGAWWKPLAIVGLCEMEWLIGALYLYALAEFFPGRLEFQEALLLYPLPQIPRALLTVPMAMLVATGVPFLAAMVGLAGVLWAVTLTALLVQRLYRLDSALPALVGGAFQALLQFLALAIVFG
ncbi:MAG: hypothetical protein ACK2UC_00580 [Anaerolineae bacterium]|jgi:hypothetical protein